MAFALAASLSALAGNAHADTTGADVCELDEGELTVSDLPSGSSVIKCDAVGRIVTYDNTGVTVPEPGTAVSVDSLSTDGTNHGFTLEVAADGTVSYDLTSASVDLSTSGSDAADVLAHPARTADDLSQESDGTDADAADSSTEAEVADVDAASAPGACSDGTYGTKDQKEYGTYNWYIGDGGLPGGLSKSDALWAFYEALDNITESHNNCGYTDQVDAHQANFLDYTSYEADINTSSQCTSRDGLSTWDAGNLRNDAVATTCSWTWPTPGIKNDLREADTRFNTHDNDFTNKPTSSCTDKYDIRSVGTHEAGHIFGLKDITGAHENLTMYTTASRCSTKARTLGKGDVLGLRSIY
ncbi:peptidase M10 [Streptomyces sp. NPDC058398]|uniref:peptidase M10 n=1 Tax=Streptomyces sp. NPDC058398 TaxID=3346479 RepID=UPI0036532A15